MATYLTARGITSRVFGFDGDVTYHAMLADYDNHADYARILEETKDLPGVTLILKSSPGNYHVHNTTARTRDETALELLSRKMDPMHVSVGYRRKRWTLRVGAKTVANASSDITGVTGEYKKAPTPIRLMENPTDRPQSKAHVQLIGYMLERVDFPDTVQGSYFLVGEALGISEYITMTKEGNHGR